MDQYICLPKLPSTNDEAFTNRVALFRSFPLQERSDELKNGDILFEGFVGNIHESEIDRPFERLELYEQLLSILQAENDLKYKNLHKGTPFYFLAWLAFDFRNYDKALFYIDAAIAEDMIHRPSDWNTKPAIQFYYLEYVHYLAKRTVTKIQEVLDNQLNRFHTILGSKITKEIFINQFVKKIVNDSDPTKRSIISALYVFLLEFNHLYDMVTTRTSHGGSALPFVIHLFRGGVILESLFKEIYPNLRKGTFEKIFANKDVKRDFGFSRIDTTAHSLSKIKGMIHSSDLKTAFSVAAQLRNTTGHNVVWGDNIFDNPENFKTFFEQEVNAILFVIAKKYLNIEIS